MKTQDQMDQEAAEKCAKKYLVVPTSEAVDIFLAGIVYGRANPVVSEDDRKAANDLAKKLVLQITKEARDSGFIYLEMTDEFWFAEGYMRAGQERAKLQKVREAFERVITKFAINHLEPDAIAEYRKEVALLDGKGG